MSDNNDPERQRAARMQMEAERRAVMQATLHARRTGKLPGGKKDSTGSEIMTAVFVLVAVVGMLALVMRYGG